MKQISNHAAAAKAIRQFMKERGIAGTVRSDSYSGGSSVRATATDLDPDTLAALEQFAGRYQYGHFDGMTDSYKYSNTNDELPQVRFVFVEVRYSDDIKQAAWDVLRAYCSGAESMPADYKALGCQMLFNDYATTIVWRFLRGGEFRQRSAEFWAARRPAPVAAAA